MQDGDWNPKGFLLQMRWQNQRNFTYYIASTVDRGLRSLEASSRIAVKYEGKNTLYKWLPFERREKYIPTSERTDNNLFKT